METRTDQASGTPMHPLGQHHQQHSSNSTSQGSTTSNAGKAAGEGLTTATRQPTADRASTSQSASCDPGVTTRTTKRESFSSCSSSAAIVASLASSSSVSALPLLAPSPDSQFTHRPYDPHHEHHHHHHHRHQHQHHIVQMDNGEGTSSATPALPSSPRRQRHDEGKCLTPTPSSPKRALRRVDQDCRDPRSGFPLSDDLETTRSSGGKGQHGERSLLPPVSVAPSMFATPLASTGIDSSSLSSDHQALTIGPVMSEGTPSTCASGEPQHPVLISREHQLASPTTLLSTAATPTPMQRSTGTRADRHEGLSPTGPSISTPTPVLHKRPISNVSPESPSRPGPSVKRKRASPAKQGYSLEPSFSVSTPADFSTAFQESRRSSLGSETSLPTTSTAKASKVAMVENTFQLQPVPACKRKRTSNENHVKWSTTTVQDNASPERRRRREGPAVHDTHNSKHPRGRAGLSTCLPQPSAAMAMPLSSRSTGVAAVSSAQDVANVVTSSEGCSPRAWATSAAVPYPARTRISRPRLSRTQSLPNLKVKPAMDLCGPALHRLAMPPRLAEYLSLLRDSAKRQQMAQEGPTAGVAGASYPQYSAHVDSRAGNKTPHLTARSRNGFCATTVDAAGQGKSVFIPALLPPITRQTLRELDLHEILKNPQLRHDIVFDSNVQFRPNFDGERGRKKKEFGNKYWFAVQREIETGCTCTSFLGKALLPCLCSRESSAMASGNTSNATLSSVRLPHPSIANYAHSLSSFAEPGSTNMVETPATGPAGTPLTSFAGGGSKIPSRLPPLIQELRAICLSVLPSSVGSVTAAGTAAVVTPTTSKLDSCVPSLGEESGLKQHAPLSAPSFVSPSGKPSATASSPVSHHHMLVDQALDANLITQQIQHGILDIAGLVKFLGSVLKQHCAPMRDDVIEKMVKTVCSEGQIALGLRMCFEILELMKLDIANHQLRSSRLYLIETAVDFENRWFREQLHHRKMSLERTLQWYLRSHGQVKDLPQSAGLTRTEVISSSIDAGFMQLIFNPAHAMAASSHSADKAANTSPLPVLILGVTPSSALYSHPCVSSYPETFQFDAFRLMSFHGDVTDISIVYMLLLLFRQLACSTTSLTGEAFVGTTTLSNDCVVRNASRIAAAEAMNVKSEIWTLLHEADLEITAAGGVSQSAITLPMPRTPSASRTAARLLNQSAFTSSQKMENSVWRAAMSNVLLQIAARAIDVQIRARNDSDVHGDERKEEGGQTLTVTSTPPPSEETMKLLSSWMESNLRMGSRLHMLCQDRLKAVVCAFVGDCSGSKRATRKHREVDGDVSKAEDSESCKKIRLQTGSHRMTQSNRGALDATASRQPQPLDSGVEAAIKKGGLEPFTAEIKLLSERITKVKTFHLRVFRSLYEAMAAEA